MHKLKHLVVAIQDREPLARVMAKAVRLAEAHNARISVVQTCWDPVSDPSTHFPQEEAESIASRLKAAELNNLSAAVARYRQQGADIQAHAIWSRRHAPAVAAFARDVAADLVLMPNHPSRALQRLRLPAALKIAGRVATPLLVCAESAWAPSVDLLVLLDAADPAHDALNERLISEAGALVDLLHGQLRLATVYELPRTALKSDADRAAFQKATEARLLDRLQAFARTGTPAPAGLHVMTGDLAQSADQLASSFQAGIIVVGTAARRGMERLWLGNNAETLLFQQTDRDLLLVPDA